MNEKKRYVEMPPELTDGENTSIMGLEDGDNIGLLVTTWLEHADEVGEQITLKIIELSDEQVAALPEV